MKIVSVKLKNFRGYSAETTITLDDLTVFLGKNDVGKSSVLEALDIFFNNGKGAIKLDKDDINKDAQANGETEVVISVCFTDLPQSIIIDRTNETSLEDEHMLNSDGNLEVIKKYPNAGTPKVYIHARHPNNPNCSDLLLCRDSELREILDDHGIECPDRTRKAVMRKSIWDYYSGDLQITDRELDITKGEVKTIWDNLQTYLPIYTLFQSDRKNSDGDSEVQDPLKEAVKEILADETLRTKLNEVASEVEAKLNQVASRTLAKLTEISPQIASSLSPVIPSSDSLKWTDVFKNVSIASDNNIPINKRGSGTKRLILLSFFRAEAERRISGENSRSVIYAIEEPETSQHAENQRVLIHAFQTLSTAPNTQVIITTHSAIIVKELAFDNLRLVVDSGDGKTISSVNPGQLPYPSLNEVNYLAFSEVSEEYHNELYGYIEECGKLGAYKAGKTEMPYIRVWQREQRLQPMNVILSEYIRHQIHHPENHYNDRYTREQLSESIELMRSFILETDFDL